MLTDQRIKQARKLLTLIKSWSSLDHQLAAYDVALVNIEEQFKSTDSCPEFQRLCVDVLGPSNNVLVTLRHKIELAKEKTTESRSEVL